MNTKVTKLTKLLLDVMYYCGFAVSFSLPVTLKLYSMINIYFQRFYWQLCILFFFSGIFAVLLVGELRKMFRTVLADDCFVMENVKSLRKMGVYAFCIAVITTLRLLLYVTPAVIIVILVFVIAGLFSKVLAEVFDTAITYKLENDLTI